MWSASRPCAVYGWNGGRTRALADLIADAGFRVIVPKLQPVMPKGGTDDDGLPPTYKFPDNADEILPWLKGNPFEEGSPLCTKTKASLEYLKGQGCTKIGTFGQCWGGWAATKATAAFGAEYGIYCIAIAHPSVQLEGLYGGDPAALAATAKVPTLLLPAAGDDPAMYGPEGTVFKGYQSGHADCETVLYADMVHGWTGRGDMSDEKVARDVDDAMTRSIEWLLKHWSA